MNGRARVEIIEIDLSSRVPSFPGIYGAMVIATSKGDVLTPRLVTSESELFRRFISTDKILPRDSLSLFEAKVFLQKSNKLWLNRPDTNATYGGAYLAQDIPVSSMPVSVNQGQSGVFLRTTTEVEAAWSKFIYSTLSDGDVIQFEGTNLPSPLVADTNYFAIKFSDKYGLRIATTQDNAIGGRYVVFTSSGSGVTLKFTPDDVNGEQQYPVRNPAGYELDTSDGKAAGFETTFNVDVDGDYLNVTKEFYKSVETGDAVTLLGEVADLPAVDSGLPLAKGETYYLIKVLQEGPNEDKYKVQLARTETAALSEEPLGLNSAGGPTFGISLDSKEDASSTTLDVDTDLFQVSQKFYNLVSDNDVLHMTATEYPVLATNPGIRFNWLDINLAVGSTIVFNTKKVLGLIAADTSVAAGCIAAYGTGKFIGVWSDPTVDANTHFGICSYNSTNFATVEDFWNSATGWSKNEYKLEEVWTHTGAWQQVNFTGFAVDSFTPANILIKAASSITEETILYALKTPNSRNIALSLTKGGPVLDWALEGKVLNFENVTKDAAVLPAIDLSKDSLNVSEMFYETTETGYEVTTSSDGVLPKGLVAGIKYFVIKTKTLKTIKLASTLGNAQAGIPVDILDGGTIDPLQNEYHHMADMHNELYTGYKRRVGYLHTSSPTDEELYYKLYHFPYGKEEDWNEFDQSCADLVKEPDAFLVVLYKKYDDQYLEVERKTCSRNPEHMDGYGRNIYVEKVFGSSNYVRWIDNKAVDKSVYPCNQTTYAKLTGGSLGHAATTGEQITALKLFNNKRRYPVTLLMDAGWSIPSYQQAIIGVCESRGATLGVLSTPIEHEQSSNYLEDLIAYRRKSLITSTSHAAMYAPHVKIYDEYNDREIYVSPTGHVGACISETAANYEPWFAPAGNRRGVLNVLGVAREFNDGDEDALYDAGINPIDFHETFGIRIWGQKTLLTRASALDRVNVRMLLIVIEPAIEALLMDYVFEFNDEFSRTMIVSKLTPYLASIKARRGLYAFKVISDESNNTNEVIDANEMIVDIPVQPVRVGELLKGRLFINNTGASFTIV